MLAQERLEQLKRQKTPYSTEELDRRGWQRYEEIRTDLEAQHYGKFVMIEVDCTVASINRPSYFSVYSEFLAHSGVLNNPLRRFLEKRIPKSL